MSTTQLAGIPVRDSLVLELAVKLRRNHRARRAERLEASVATRQDTVSLTIADREAILRALEDPPPGLEALQAVLLNQRIWRRTEGL